MLSRKKGFTIVELLVVMSIIIILMSILAPATNMLRRYAKNTSQQVQFVDIRKGLDMFEIDYGYYPDSEATDFSAAPGQPYCGAMKLAEAMLGQDGHGFHSESRFFADGMVGGIDLYPVAPPVPVTPAYKENLGLRTKYLENGNIVSYRMQDVYGPTLGVGTFNGKSAVISDVFKSIVNQSTQERVGMPILYYRYNRGRFSHDIAMPTNTDNIYNFEDNQDLVMLGVPFDTTQVHPLGGVSIPGDKFYEDTLDKNANIPLPCNKDTYILISAGNDGLYGTRDDVYNFQK